MFFIGNVFKHTEFELILMFVGLKAGIQMGEDRKAYIGAVSVFKNA